MFDRLKKRINSLVNNVRSVVSKPAIRQFKQINNSHPIAEELEPRLTKTEMSTLGSGERLSRREIREFRRLEKRWNKEHDRYWSKFLKVPLFSGAQVQDVTVAEHNAQTRSFRNAFQQPLYTRNAKFNKIRDRKTFERLKEVMKYETSDAYKIDRVNTFTKNIERNLNFYGNEELTNAFKSLTFEQKQILQDSTLFTADFFELIPSDPNKLTGTQKAEIAERVDRMKAEIARVSQL